MYNVTKILRCPMNGIPSITHCTWKHGGLFEQRVSTNSVPGFIWFNNCTGLYFDGSSGNLFIGAAI